MSLNTPRERTAGFQAYDRGNEDEIGRRGEEAFRDFLWRNDISHYVNLVEGQYEHERWDFRIGRLTVEVKAIPDRPGYSHLLVPIHQGVRANIYTATKGDYVRGWLWGREVWNLPIDEGKKFGKEDCRYAEVEELRSVDKLARELRNEAINHKARGGFRDR